ncbi:hypothetical protein KIPB_016347, partial [Kipferlia bialata]
QGQFNKPPMGPGQFQQRQQFQGHQGHQQQQQGQFQRPMHQGQVWTTLHFSLTHIYVTSLTLIDCQCTRDR